MQRLCRFNPVLLKVSLIFLFSLTSVYANRHIWIKGEPTHPIIETKLLDSGTEAIPVWFLPRLGISISNDSESLELRYEEKTLFYVYGVGWEGNFDVSADLPVPETYHTSRHVSLRVLEELGIPFNTTDETLSVYPPPKPPLTLTNVRRSVTREDNLETSRLVLEFSDTVDFELKKTPQKISLVLPNFKANPKAPLTQELPGMGTIGYHLLLGSRQTHFNLETATGSNTEVFTLEDPFRIVLDTRLKLESTPTRPGIEYHTQGLLHTISFDPKQYQPKITSAQRGTGLSVGEFVQLNNAVGGVNGGYFDPATSLPVDLVTLNGQMLSSSLERRATLGIRQDGTLHLGFPKPRYVASGDFGTVRINTIGSKANPDWLTLFVGDGKTAVGDDDLQTLYLKNNSVSRIVNGRNVPGANVWTLTYSRKRFPKLPEKVGQSIDLSLHWYSEDWQDTKEALAAGPMLIRDGQYVLNPKQEGFNTQGSIWRRTRQVAFGISQDGRYVIAYLEWGTPEEFARALLKTNIHTALRLDSGSSASVFAAGKYLNHGNRRKVPNAIVMVPKKTSTAQAQR
ncbi:MAG: phosphodiester glycosidase family protein [Deinococcaceae bacterium]